MDTQQYVTYAFFSVRVNMRSIAPHFPGAVDDQFHDATDVMFYTFSLERRSGYRRTKAQDTVLSRNARINQ